MVNILKIAKKTKPSTGKTCRLKLPKELQKIKLTLFLHCGEGKILSVRFFVINPFKK